MKRVNPSGDVASWYLADAKGGHEQFIQPSKRYADLILWGDLKERSIAALVAVIRNMGTLL